MTEQRPLSSGRARDEAGPTRLRDRALAVIAFGVVVVLLHQAAFVLSALVVAAILFSLTADAISAIARLRFGRLAVPNWLASVAALTLISVALFTLTSLILAQLNDVLTLAFTYAARAPEATADLFAWAGPEIASAVREAMRSVDLTRDLRTLAAQAGDLMQGTVLVILFVAFLFAERARFETKLTRLLGSEERAEQARALLGSITHQVNRYLVVKTVVSALTGTLVFAACWAWGLALAGAVGVITFLFNYLPNIGSIVATLLVGLIAHVQFENAATTLALLAMVSGIQFVCGNILDPVLTGRALRLSTFGILLSLAFWGLIWGVAGMFLCVPIMVALMLTAGRVPALRPLAVLLSRDGSLPEPEAARRR